MSEPDSTRPTTSVAISKPSRVLACMLCHQRKVKCERKFPCTYCVRAGVECVPVNPLGPRPRRRRFPERELLERLRYYETLLRENNVNFDPLHPASNSPGKSQCESSKEEMTSTPKETKDLWHVINRVTLDDDPDKEVTIDEDESSASDNSHPSGRNDSILQSAGFLRFQCDIELANVHLFLGGSFGTRTDLSKYHPEQVEIFRLWQIYLDNINPLLKVTHTQTLQIRIIDAVSDWSKVSPGLEALIFSIYSISIMSISENECATLFQSPKRELLAYYQSACQKALRKYIGWKTDDIDGLTATYLYCLSIRPLVDPRLLPCMLAFAIRIARRMGLDSESSYIDTTPFESEARRRLWWSLIIFDHRICEMTDYKITSLTPTWDCSTPCNLNDFEIRPDMKKTPAIHDTPTEALFVVVQSEVADFVRHSSFHLDFVNPILNTIAKPKFGDHETLNGGEVLVALEKAIEDKYFNLCDPEDPLHYMTLWTTRASLARQRLQIYYSQNSTTSARPTDSQRNVAIAHAIAMLDCDTKLRTSARTQKYLWYTDFRFPALAYMAILNDLVKRPTEDHTEKAWLAMDDNYRALEACSESGEHGILNIYSIFVIKFSQLVFRAWEARESFLRQEDRSAQPPWMVSDMRMKMVEMSANPTLDHGPPHITSEIDQNIGFDTQPSPFTLMDLAEQQSSTKIGASACDLEAVGEAIPDVEITQFWNEMDSRYLPA